MPTDRFKAILFTLRRSSGIVILVGVVLLLLAVYLLPICFPSAQYWVLGTFAQLVSLIIVSIGVISLFWREDIEKTKFMWEIAAFAAAALFLALKLLEGEANAGMDVSIETTRVEIQNQSNPPTDYLAVILKMKSSKNNKARTSNCIYQRKCHTLSRN